MRNLTLGAILLLAIAMIPALVCARDSTLPATALTVITETQRVTTATGSHLLLAGIEGEREGEVVLSLVWGLDPGAFFPVWSLELWSDVVTLENAAPTRSGVESKSRRNLAHISPEPDHTYEATLSFDAESGVVGVTVLDVTTGSYVHRSMVGAQPYAAPLRPSVVSSASLVAVHDSFVPVGVRWSVVQPAEGEEANTTISLSRITTHLQPYVHIADPGAALPGSFRLVGTQGERSVELGRFDAAHLEPLIPFEITSLSPGTWELDLLYEAAGHAWRLDTKSISLVGGTVFARIGSIQRVDPFGTPEAVRGTLELWSAEGQLSIRHLQLLADVGGGDEWTPVLKVSETLDLTPTPVSIPFELVVPTRDYSDVPVSFRIAAEDADWELISLNLDQVAVRPEGFRETVVFTSDPSYKPTYRIPAIVEVGNGDLLAFAERRNHGRTDVGHIDLVMKRSTDRGQTWGEEVVVFDEALYTSHADPTPFYDPDTGRLWLFFLWDKKVYYVMTSDDDGYTWSKARSIHDQVTRPEWSRVQQGYGIGPGSGVVKIQTGPYAGRIVVPARHRELINGVATHTSHVFFSDDGGESWQVGETAIVFGNENQLVLLEDGSIMMNSRDGDLNAPQGTIRRRVAISHDGGSTWTHQRRDESLISPGVHGSIERLSWSADGQSRIVFVNPYTTQGRRNLSVRISYDEGNTWTEGKTLYPHASSYSDIVVLSDGTIGVLYERGAAGSTAYWEEIAFARFTLEWVTEGRDALE